MKQLRGVNASIGIASFTFADEDLRVAHSIILSVFQESWIFREAVIS